MITKEYEYIEQLRRKYNIPNDVSYFNDREYIKFIKIENNQMKTMWKISRKAPMKNIEYYECTIIHYKLVNNRYLYHNEEEYAYVSYHDDDIRFKAYYIEGNEISKELVEVNPEILKDANLRKILL